MGFPKLICTLGTTTDSRETLEQMIAGGMDCVRINTAYATLADYKRRIEMVRAIKSIPIMLDLKGPQLRLTDPGYVYEIRKGVTIRLGFDKSCKNADIYANHDFYDDIRPGDSICFENGTIKTVVVKTDDSERVLELEVAEEGEEKLTRFMGINVPERQLNLPALTENDKEVVGFGIMHRCEYLALSFVRNYGDVRNLLGYVDAKKRELQEAGWIGSDYTHSFKICVKIEDRAGVKNLADTIRQAKEDKVELSVMVARGDLYVEIPNELFPRVQKHIIRTCNSHGVPVITATGLLESMQHSKEPTRSELCDVANALLDGSDSLMLSGETSNGKHPVLAVRKLKSMIDEYCKN